MSEFLTILLFFALFSTSHTLANNNKDTITVSLRHIDSKGNYTKLEQLQRAAARTKYRGRKILETILNLTNVQAPVHVGTAEFLMDLSIGTPPLAFSAILDTGSDLIWTQCEPCTQCFAQSTPIYNPSNSTTYINVTCTNPLCQVLPPTSCSPYCQYSYAYAGGSYTKGVLGTETFTFGNEKVSVVINGLTFGCGSSNGGGADNSAGIVGMGRGSLSLVSQLQDKLFSYCLTSYNDPLSSTLIIGSLAPQNFTAPKSMPFVTNPNIVPLSSFYYLPLQGITVGAQLLANVTNTTFALKPDGTGGIIIDSGTTLTLLDDSVYQELKQSFIAQTNLAVVDGSSVGLDLCFSISPGSSPAVPALVFHFQGADMDLPVENYMAFVSNDVMCLIMLGWNYGISIFGNFQQQNMHILYDLNMEMLSFEPAQCNLY